ncbi:MAG: hypothetical protein HC934_13455 [Acaryochloridaceae cyanobacterium SU_2_1]|nr:hypothetical protein [Acaryochloridaceae cyanobacterium SU_2_1]
MIKKTILSGLGIPLILGLIFWSSGRVRSHPSPTVLARPWFNCLTRELWSPEKKAWCQGQDQDLLSGSSTQQPKDRNQYESLDLNRFPAQDIVGEDPKTIALQIFALPELSEDNFQEQVKVSIDNDQTAIVVLTRIGLADDSVRGLKYLLELAPTGIPIQPPGTLAPQRLWKVTWIGRQQLCQPNRGSQDWTRATCN